MVASGSQLEIERKFLVSDDFPRDVESVLIRQGYLAGDKQVSVRIRQLGECYWLSVKARVNDLVRHEFEYQVPASDGQLMLEQHCTGPLIEKRRYLVRNADLCWEVDCFFGENEGLIVAEIELESEGQIFDIPAWVGEEVTHDLRYLNTSLSLNPYKHW